VTIEIEQNKQADKIARDILTLSRNSLLVSLRFLDKAISQLKFQQEEEINTIAIDGQNVYYNTWHVLNSYKLQKENTTRDTLHMVFHCLFHHPFVNTLVHQGCWDLACDIATENAINDLQLNIVANQRQGRQADIIGKLKKELKLMTAEKIYRHYLDQNLDDQQIEALRQNFQADKHDIWYRPLEEKGNEQADEKVQGLQVESGPLAGDDKQKLLAIWKEISERVQVDIETASRQWGNQKGGLFQGLKKVNREKYDYASFLQRFAVRGEAMQINDDEFDLIFYTYGLSLYKNMPLIEPLEYKDVKRIKEFVIAIDTSGSVQGKTVQAFIQKSYNILKQSESFFTKINIHIIQCDAQIQEDFKITNSDELEKYIQSLVLHGFGGTDFRPVFSYIDALIENKEFENLKGLIYFTDGWGVYPAQKPDYDTAFVFLDEDYISIPEIPPWAIKLVLSADDVMR